MQRWGVKCRVVFLGSKMCDYAPVELINAQIKNHVMDHRDVTVTVMKKKSSGSARTRAGRGAGSVVLNSVAMNSVLFTVDDTQELVVSTMNLEDLRKRKLVQALLTVNETNSFNCFRHVW